MKTEPTLDFTQEGLRHRKWIIPARMSSEYGNEAERHYYAVGDDPYAVSFTVYTGRYVRDAFNTHPRGIDLSWHRSGGDNHGCLCLSGAICESVGTIIEADEWYAQQPRDAQGFVPDNLIFDLLRVRHGEWA